jgi:hypothetical protein
MLKLKKKVFSTEKLFPDGSRVWFLLSAILLDFMPVELLSV